MSPDNKGRNKQLSINGLGQEGVKVEGVGYKEFS